MVFWFVVCLFVLLIGWLVGWLVWLYVCWLVGKGYCLFGCLVLVCSLVCLVGWFCVWLAAWLVSCVDNDRREGEGVLFVGLYCFVWLSCSFCYVWFAVLFSLFVCLFVCLFVFTCFVSFV